MCQGPTPPPSSCEPFAKAICYVELRGVIRLWAVWAIETHFIWQWVKPIALLFRCRA